MTDLLTRAERPEKANTISTTVVSVLVVAAFGAVVILLLWRPVDLGPTVSDLLKILLGVLASKFGTVVDFYLGSSIGSRLKDEAAARRDGSQ